MIHYLQGKISEKLPDFFVLDIGGFGIKIFSSKRSISSLPAVDSGIKIYSRLFVRETAFEIYGFISARELDFFELLNTVGGVGPKSALSVMDVAPLNGLLSAIKEERSDLFSQASGVGKKTAERIILELKNKVEAEGSTEAIKKMEIDSDLVDTLAGLGYGRDQAKRALDKVPKEFSSLEKRLKEALKILSDQKHA